MREVVRGQEHDGEPDIECVAFKLLDQGRALVRLIREDDGVEAESFEDPRDTLAHPIVTPCTTKIALPYAIGPPWGPLPIASTSSGASTYSSASTKPRSLFTAFEIASRW